MLIYINADNLIEYDGMRRASDETYINDATVTFTLKDSNGNAVTGATTVAMAYVSGSDGKYQGTLDSTVTLTENAYYTVEFTATSGTLNDFRRLSVQAKYRTE